VITDDTFMQYEGFDMATFDEKSWPQSDLPTWRVLKHEDYAVFRSKVARHFQLPESSVRLWVMVNRQNRTVRPDSPIPENEPGLSELSSERVFYMSNPNLLAVEMIRINMAARQYDLRLYLDVVQDRYNKPEVPKDYIMVLLKHFDTSKQSLYGIGKLYVNRSSKVSDLFADINERMRWAPGTRLKLYEEIKPGMVELMNLKFTFMQSEIQDGDIICFQVDLAEQEYVSLHMSETVYGTDLAYRIHDLESQGLYSNPIQYYDFIQNRIMVLFQPKNEEPDQNNPDFSLVLSKKQNYDIVSVYFHSEECLPTTASIIDVIKSWRVPATRPHQTPLYDDKSDEWRGQGSP
jgi:ubiquitin carboxyl-terminal hydrolase 7